VGIAAMMTASALNAAITWTDKVAIPFSFQVSKTTMPAGDYRIQQGVSSDIAILQNVKTGQQVQFLRTPAAHVEGRARLVFHTTPTGHVLKSIS
jgi:hypothetical protein